jgi:anti-sigma-K factor RskA
MNHDIHALSGAYAVDALDDTERADFERHLAGCAACGAEVQSFRVTTTLLAGSEAETAPPASLRASVLAGISQVRPFPPEAPSAQASGPDSRVVTLRRRLLPTLVAAAAVLILVSAGAFAWHPWSSGKTDVADQVLHAADAVMVTDKLPGGGGELTLVRSASLNRAVMVGADVPAPADGTTYELWLQQPGEEMQPAGLMPDGDGPTLLMGNSATAVAAAVSVEPEGGSAHPSKNVVAVFHLGSAPGKSGA